MGTGLLRFVTAGSVDDGKSTLIGRLLHDSKGLFSDQLTAVEAASKKRGFTEVDLSLLTDGLLAEREQGITIDVAYRYFATPARKFIIGDCPGHEQYTRNMVTAASTADAAILLVDARHGLRVQTRRHAYLARWLGVPRVLLAVNKMDLLGGDRSRFETLAAEFAEFARPLGFTQVHAMPVSALRGDMVVERGDLLSWYEGPTLMQWLETVATRHDDLQERDNTRSSLRLPVQRVARVMLGNAQPGVELPSGEFRGYQGTVASGSIAVGDEVAILPSGARARVASLVTADGPLTHAGPDHAVTVTLDREVDVSRGDVISGVDHPATVLREIEADICWFDSASLSPGRTLLLKHATRSVRARVAQVRWRVDVNSLEHRPATGDIAMNDVFRARLQLQQPIAADAYDEHRVTGSFILIDEASFNTIAAGTIASPEAQAPWATAA